MFVAQKSPPTKAGPQLLCAKVAAELQIPLSSSAHGCLGGWRHPFGTQRYPQCGRLGIQIIMKCASNVYLQQYHHAPNMFKPQAWRCHGGLGRLSSQWLLLQRQPSPLSTTSIATAMVHHQHPMPPFPTVHDQPLWTVVVR